MPATISEPQDTTNLHLAIADLSNRLAGKAGADDLAAAEARVKEVLTRFAHAVDAEHARMAAQVQEAASRPSAASRLSEVVLGTLRAVAMVLAVRLLLLLALGGTFVLSVMAMQAQSVIGVCLTAVFALLTLAPLVAVEIKQRPVPSA